MLSLSQLSPVQAMAAAAPPAQYSPGLHAAHTGGELTVPAAICLVPALHSLSDVHTVWFTP